MARQNIFNMKMARIYSLLLQKLEKKERTKEELDAVIEWLTGYYMNQVNMEVSLEEFFNNAPAINPKAILIKGKVCGVQVETIEDSLMQKIRWLDKLIDELAKGKPLEKVLRQE